jgi:hypothetical protein
MRKVSLSTRVAAGTGAVFVAAFSLFLADRASGSSSNQPAPSATTAPVSATASPSTPDTGGAVATTPTSPPETQPPVQHIHTRSRGS